MKRIAITLFGGLLLVAPPMLAKSFAQPADPDPNPRPVLPARPDADKPAPVMEVVFVLDTTGSMSGLIASAKERIWSIASALAMAKPAPVIRMGLVAYRDRGDEYVTKLTALSDDLDAVYKELMELQAGGGGDTPESVNQGLHEALTKIEWNMAKEVVRVVFVVGDCPPHMDYENDVRYPESCKLANERGIVINTIQCGSHAQTTPIWQDMAKLGGGKFFAVEQGGGAAAIATPFDEDLAKASQKYDATRIWYGSERERAAQSMRDENASKIYDAAPAAAQAARAGFNQSESGKSNWIGSGRELLTELAEGRIKLEDVKDEQLPEEMRKMTLDERVAHIAKVKAERDELKKRIDELVAKRKDFVEAEMKKRAAAGGSWESAVFDSVAEQAARAGIRIARPDAE